MKKFNVTYEQVASYSNIYAAYLDARKGKSERNEIMRFSLELDAHLNDLYNDLQEERYKSKRVQNYLYSCAKETAYYGVTIPGSRFTMGGL